MSFQPAKIQLLQTIADQNHFEIQHWYTSTPLYGQNNFVSGSLVFQSFLESYRFCRKCLQYTDFEFSSSFFEFLNKDIASNTLNAISEHLNYNCIHLIADHLDVISLADLISTHPQYINMAKRKFVNLVVDESTVGRNFGVMNFAYILRTCGAIVESIVVSLRSFRSGSRTNWNFKLKYALLSCITNSNCQRLNSVTLNHFGFNLDIDGPRIAPLSSALQDRNVIINMN